MFSEGRRIIVSAAPAAKPRARVARVVIAASPHSAFILYIISARRTLSDVLDEIIRYARSHFALRCEPWTLDGIFFDGKRCCAYTQSTLPDRGCYRGGWLDICARCIPLVRAHSLPTSNYALISRRRTQ